MVRTVSSINLPTYQVPLNQVLPKFLLFRVEDRQASVMLWTWIWAHDVRSADEADGIINIRLRPA